MKERDVGGLRCGQVLEALSDFVDGELDADTTARIEGHLAGCPNCDRFGRSFQRMVEALRGSEGPELPPEVRARIEAMIDG